MKCNRILPVMLAAVLLSPPVAAQRQLIEPEAATGWTSGELAQAKRYMIATASIPASRAGLEILQAGGSAADAAIAAQLVLGLVEPQSSGLGGGAFMLHWDQAGRQLVTYDGRETAPSAAKPDRFLRDGRPMPFDTAVHSGLSVGTPGLVRLLEATHKAHGKLPWAKLFEPAIRMADEGFEVTSRLHLLLRWSGAQSFDATARAYFFDSGDAPRPIGYKLQNPAYAATLRAIAARGAEAFYTGDIADAIVKAAADAPNAAGDLTHDDLANYRIAMREPVCAPYRLHKICGMGPPSSGGTAIAQILQLLEPYDLGSGASDAMNPRALHLIAEAEKLAYADRNRYLADPDFVSIPRGLTAADYISQRRRLIDGARAMDRPEPGHPDGSSQNLFGRDATVERAGTSHISVIDADGNAVAMTTTIEGAFGSGIMAAGFLLNNELTDFSFQPADSSGVTIANRVEPGKRPRSTMSPTFVFGPEGHVSAVLGSPGGGRIILYVTKALVALLDWKLDAHAASALPNFGSMGSGLEMEYDWHTVLLGLRLKTYGHEIRPDLMNSGLNIVTRRGGVLEGGSDPRREGAALGD